MLKRMVCEMSKKSDFEIKSLVKDFSKVESILFIGKVLNEPVKLQDVEEIDNCLDEIMDKYSVGQISKEFLMDCYYYVKAIGDEQRALKAEEWAVKNSSKIRKHLK